MLFRKGNICFMYNNPHLIYRLRYKDYKQKTATCHLTSSNLYDITLISQKNTTFSPKKKQGQTNNDVICYVSVLNNIYILDKTITSYCACLSVVLYSPPKTSGYNISLLTNDHHKLFY